LPALTRCQPASSNVPNSQILSHYLTLLCKQQSGAMHSSRKKAHTFRQYQKSGNAGIASKNPAGKVNRIGIRFLALQGYEELLVSFVFSASNSRFRLFEKPWVMWPIAGSETLAFVRPGDLLLVWKLDQQVRSLSDPFSRTQLGYLLISHECAKDREDRTR
jgi:hypothetical protein